MFYPTTQQAYLNKLVSFLATKYKTMAIVYDDTLLAADWVGLAETYFGQHGGSVTSKGQFSSENGTVPQMEDLVKTVRKGEGLVVRDWGDRRSDGAGGNERWGGSLRTHWAHADMRHAATHVLVDARIGAGVYGCVVTTLYVAPPGSPACMKLQITVSEHWARMRAASAS